MRALSSALVLSAALLAHAQVAEVAHGAVGAVFPVGPAEPRLEAGWSLAFGGVCWLSDRFGIHSELGVQRMGLSDRLRNELGAAKDGTATIYSIPVNAMFALHDPGGPGLYLLAGAGLYHRRLDLFEASPAPLPRDEPWAGVRSGWVPQETYGTTRAGLDAGIGWETPLARGTFFVELRYHRVFTRGLPTEFVPLLVGTRF